FAFASKNKKKLSDKELYITGEKLLEERNALVDELDILADGFENCDRPTKLVKVLPAYGIFKELIVYYGVSQLVNLAIDEKINSWKDFTMILPLKARRAAWVNAGSQLLPQDSVNTLLRQIHSGKIKNWNEVHQFYQKNGELYKDQKLQHAFASLFEI